MLKFFLIKKSQKKKKRFEDAEKLKMEFESKLSSITISGNKANKQLSEIEIL